MTIQKGARMKIKKLVCIACICITQAIYAGETTPESNLSDLRQDSSIPDPRILDFASDSTRTIYERYFIDFGNYAQFLPAVSLSYTLIIRDFIGFKQQAISTISVVAATYAIKYAFHGLSLIDKDWASISMRPSGLAFEGFPSGHTSAAFAATGFLQKRYGFKLGIPALIVSSAVGVSRIVANRHTWVQVIGGGLLGFLISFFLATPYRKKSNPNNPYNPSSTKSDSKKMLLECAFLCLAFV